MRAATIRTILLLAVAASGCAPELGPPPGNAGEGQSFGAKFFTVACQRVAYTSSLRARELALEAGEPPLPVDVSGSRYRLACRFGPAHLPEGAADEDPKVATLVRARPSFVDAIDLVFPEEELSALQDYMVRLLPATDDDSFPELLRKAAGVMEELEGDAALHTGLARLEGRVGYRPRAVALGLIRELVAYPELQPTLARLIDLVAEGGAANRQFLDLIEAVGFELRGAQKANNPTIADPERSLQLGLDLLLQQHPAFASEPKPVLLVRRDHRGLAQVNRAGGTLPAPFVDGNGDGLADQDELGRFKTVAGTAPAPFRIDPGAPDSAVSRDAESRALDAQGKLLYDYLDLDRTLLAGLARDGVKLLDATRDRAFQLLLGASGLLGERRPVKKENGLGESLAYSGFDAAHAPLLDLLHGVLQVLRDPAIDGTLEAARLLIKEHEAPTARLVGAALDARERGKRHPEARVEPTSNLFDDLVPLLREIANTPGLLEDLIHAFADPRTRNLGGMLQNYFTYRDAHELDASTQKVKISGSPFQQKVDRGQPDTGANRSIQQRLFHIINNTNGMRICNKENACFGVKIAGTDLCLKKFKACDLFEIENGAVFYMQSIARLRDGGGNLTGTPKATIRLKTENMPGWLATIVDTVGHDSLLKLATGIEGFSTHPTTEAINRQMFLDPLPAMLALMIDPAVDIDGHVIPKYHPGTLLEWESIHPQFSCSANDPCRFYDSFRPAVQAFADHNKEKLFLDLLSVLHKHWASRASTTFQFTDPGGKDFAWGSAVASYEPLIIELLETGELMNALYDVARVLDTAKLADGTPVKTALARTVAFLVDADRSPGLTYRDGRTSSLKSDGKTAVPGGVSPFYLLADAFAAKRQTIDRLGAGSDRRLAEAWNQSTSDLVDIFLAVEGSGIAHKFVNRRLPAAGEVLIDFLRARLASHRQKGDTARWLGQDLPADIERALAGPVVARAADFLRVLDGDTATKRKIYDLGRYLVDELASNATFRAALTGLADVVQLLLDDDDLVPVARALGRALDPGRGLVPAALRFLGPALAADGEEPCEPAGASCGAGRRCIQVGRGESRCSREMLQRVLRNAYREKPDAPGVTPVQVLLDLSTELHRLKPGAGTPYTWQDFAEAFRQAREFLGDTETGLVKFFEIVRHRCGGLCPVGGSP